MPKPQMSYGRTGNQCREHRDKKWCKVYCPSCVREVCEQRDDLLAAAKTRNDAVLVIDRIRVIAFHPRKEPAVMVGEIRDVLDRLTIAKAEGK